jgi:hypothetical protein
MHAPQCGHLRVQPWLALLPGALLLALPAHGLLANHRDREMPDRLVLAAD